MSDNFVKMSPKYALGIALYIGSRVLANPIVQRLSDREPGNPIAQRPGDNVSFPRAYFTQTYPASDPLPFDLEPTSASNPSPTLVNVTSSEDVHIQCDGASYGFDLDISDCEEAMAYFPTYPDQVQWAERHTDSQTQIFSLPYRAMGDKASCYIQPVVIDGATSANAAPNEVRNAAAMIRDRCASGGKLQGGMATSIGKKRTALSWLALAASLTVYSKTYILRYVGGDNRLAVIMGAYQSPSAIQCRGAFPSSDSCHSVLEDMPATTKMEFFGNAENTSATVLLPQSVWQGKPHYETSIHFSHPFLIDCRVASVPCRLGLSSTFDVALLDTGSWYEVWEATIALWSVCTRHRSRGIIHSIGEFPEQSLYHSVLTRSSSQGIVAASP